ncbi:MAG: CsbD family protein [Acidobacteria bacterium]|nr:CsbD family protein [Acidobacteriota bacterium]
MPNKDEVKGKLNQVKGQVKQGVGDATGNDRLHDEGVADEAAGDVQEGAGKVKRKVGDAVKDLGDRIKN